MVDLAVDLGGSTVVLGNSTGGIYSYRLRKFAADGTLEWYKPHAITSIELRGSAIAALPNRGSLIAGYTYNDTPTEVGLLSWHAADGSHVQDAVFDGEDLPTALLDVAVSIDGHAVAVGYCGANKQLCLLKVTI
jgi:hypothetical protein